jgi:hypothetical protein
MTNKQQNKLLMRHFKLSIFFFGLLLFSCSHADSKKTSVTENQTPTTTDDKEQIQNLIRQMLNWSESKNSINLLPVLTDSKDSSCVGFDFDKHKLNLDKLRKTNLFAEEFIENYNQIILTLDKKIKNREFEKWNIYELPTFNFANDVDPWTLCQDVPYDNPNPYDLVEVIVIKSDNEKADLNWTWGKLELNSDKSWKKFTYKFRVVKENSNWEIAYLRGFDFKESTR